MLTLTTAIRNTMTDAIVDSLDAGAGPGTIQIRSGTRPADPATTATGTLLATVTCADPAFGSASSGAATISDPAAVTAVATGTATWFRALDSNGGRVLRRPGDRDRRRRGPHPDHHQHRVRDAGGRHRRDDHRAAGHHPLIVSPKPIEGG
jgi:hypothetical protein